MRAAVMTKPFTIEFQDIPCPVPGPKDVLVRVKAAGICGSDIHFYDVSNPYARYPQVFGHELSGVIEEVGVEVTGRKVGERVVVEPAVPCRQCYACRIGKYNACRDIGMIGSVRAGGFADLLSVPERHVHVIPDEINYEIGALCEPFTIGAQAIHRSAMKSGNTVTVLGTGPIGLTILAHIKQRYEVQTFAVDIIPERLELAKKFGADETINAKRQEVSEVIDKQTNGEGSNIVIESAGIKRTIEQTIQLVSPGGRIVIVGLTGADVCFPGQLLTKKDVELYGTRHSVNKFPQVIQFLSQHKELAESFITRKMPFIEIESALQMAKDYPDKVTKIMLQY